MSTLRLELACVGQLLFYKYSGCLVFIFLHEAQKSNVENPRLDRAHKTDETYFCYQRPGTDLHSQGRHNPQPGTIVIDSD